MTRERLTNTPYLDKWISNVKKSLEPRGKKARLIEFLASVDETSIAVKRVELAAILRGERIPNGETLLRINAFLEKPKK